jgi:hypothetical protein
MRIPFIVSEIEKVSNFKTIKSKDIILALNGSLQNILINKQFEKL